MKRALIGVAGLLLLGAITWLAWSGRTSTVPADGREPAPALHDQQDTGTAALSAGTERQELATTPATKDAAMVTLRGRCIDPGSGEALAGCKLELRGLPGAAHRMTAWLRDHGEISWNDPPGQTTAADGRFRFRFVPPPPYGFTLDIRAPGRVRVRVGWTSLKEGADKDLGDIALQRGSTVTGRVDDSAGVPQGEVEIELTWQNPRYWRSAAGDHLLARHRTLSAPDGTFAFDERVAVGTWNVTVAQRELVTAASLEIRDGQPFTTLVLVTRPPGSAGTITGRVVDEDGRPIEAVEVRYQPRDRDAPESDVATDHDGRFVLERRARDPEGPVRLVFDCRGFEHLAAKESQPWGAKDLQFVMQRGLSVDVMVVDGMTGEPIEDYGVRCIPAPGGHRTPEDRAPRGKGHHPGGQLRLEGIRRGKHVLLVEPIDAAWQASDFHFFEMTDEGAPAQRVELFRPVNRTLRVERVGGARVAGTEVELLRPLAAQAVTMDSPATNAGGLFGRWNQAGVAILIMKGRTNSAGELTLAGPPRSTFALRLHGPGHQPLVVPGVILAADAAPLLVTVQNGATVTGRIGPPDVLARLRPGAGVPAPSGADPKVLARREKLRPALLLYGKNAAGRRVSYPRAGHRDRLPLRADGTFEMIGVPTGSWDLHLSFALDNGLGTWTHTSQPIERLAALEEGETREIDVDVSHLLPARITGVVMLNGVPLEEADVHMLGTRPDGRGGEAEVSCPGRKLGKGGTFALTAIPATYQLSVELPRRPTGPPRFLPAPERLEVEPGKDVHQVFHLQAGALGIRVRGTGDRPLAGVQMLVATPDWSWITRPPATDERGHTEVDTVLAGTVVLSVVPKQLTTQEAMQAFLQANADDPKAWQKAPVPLRRIEVIAGKEPTEVEVVLPASAGY